MAALICVARDERFSPGVRQVNRPLRLELGAEASPPDSRPDYFGREAPMFSHILLRLPDAVARQR